MNNKGAVAKDLQAIKNSYNYPEMCLYIKYDDLVAQPEIFNVLGQLKTIERVKKSGEMIYNKKEQLAHDLGAKEK